MSDLVFWDVQHGHATYVRSPNGRCAVVDLGVGSYSGGQTFSPLTSLYDQGLRHIDELIVSHPHLDHIDDILNVSAFTVGVFARPRHLTKGDVMKNVRQGDQAKFDAYWALHETFVHPVGVGNDAQDPANFGGLSIRAFVPSSCGRSNLNNHSVVTVFEEAGVKVVVPGDNESCAFDELLQDASFCTAVKDADLLLAPHHGRAAGTHAGFLKLVNPSLCVISDGRATETSAVGTYTAAARGWSVYKRSGGSETRYCLSTRSDGTISVSFGQGASGPYLHVEVP